MIRSLRGWPSRLGLARRRHWRRRSPFVRDLRPHADPSRCKGKVLSFQWTNPHGYIELDVHEGPKGVDHYTRRAHEHQHAAAGGLEVVATCSAGDEVTAVIAPLLNGDPGGLLLELKVPDGRTLVPPVPAIGTFKRTQP